MKQLLDMAYEKTERKNYKELLSFLVLVKIICILYSIFQFAVLKYAWI